METFCATSVNPSKFRNNYTNNYYHNIPPRTVRQGSEYAFPNCNTRRTPTITHNHMWQDRIPRSTRSCVGVGGKPKPSKGRLCSIALAVASFVVLVAVLAIAGMALYMGALHTETSTLITFSCSAKVSRGDRFIGALQEKARRYKRQLEALYQKSTLGPALAAVSLDSFSNDTFTFHYRLSFVRKKLTKSPASVEKNIKDILLSDAISRKPIFKNIRFDPRSIHVKQQQSENDYHSSFKPKENISLKPIKTGVVLKTVQSNNSIARPIPQSKPAVKDEPIIKEEDLPVIQGSFKISKTDADITEKKTEQGQKTKTEKFTTPSTKKITAKEVNSSALYKMAAVEKVTKSTTPSTSLKPNVSMSSTTKNSISTSTPTSTSGLQSTTPFFVINPHLFDEEPWVPILPGPETRGAVTEEPIEAEPEVSIKTSTVTSAPGKKSPVYTSFTNPALSFHFLDSEQLGSTSLKGHPIPVNKIPEPTEPSLFLSKFTEVPLLTKTDKIEEEQKPIKNAQSNQTFVEIETVKYIPGSGSAALPETTEVNKEQMLKNISEIFHTLVSSLETDHVNLSNLKPDENFVPKEEETIEEIVGQGQVEVVEGDVEDLMLQTTKLPLVTLLPVKSNSGIGRPLRKRPFKAGDNNLSVENRSFPSYHKLNSNSETSTTKDNKNTPKLENFKIMGILNFAKEGLEYESGGEEKNQDNIVRYPKMEDGNGTETGSGINNEEVMVYATNSSVRASSEKKLEEAKNQNILSAEKIKQLSEISKILNNSTHETNISNKAVASTYTINQAGLKILTKTFNKISETSKIEKIQPLYEAQNTTECNNSSVTCGDGTCLPETTKCNQLIDCNDGVDEQGCTCMNYLKSQYLMRKICDGVVDCWDYSDENNCEWCSPDQYVCGNSKTCIEKNKICDGNIDCPQGDDERQCVTIASNTKVAEEFPYYSSGYLIVRKHGVWGKLCVDNFDNTILKSHLSWKISDLGKAVCKSMTYQSMESVESMDDNQDESPYFEFASLHNETKNLMFKETSCSNRKVIKVKCKNLECGARPQATKHIARVVGGGNAGLGAWPWQAALYKEGEFQCGATLLSDKWLVSAGHCFYKSQDEHWVARLGALTRGTSLPSPYEQLRAISVIIVHPGYIDSGFINDISLLKMEFPIVFSDYVRPVCLPPPGQVPGDGELCTVVGWGQLFEVGRIFPDTLQEVQVPVISTAECRKRTVFLPLYRITDDMFCAGFERGGRDACLGDSGGPLMCAGTNGQWILQGITSNGYGCARANRPGVYTKVANYINWMQSHIEEDEALNVTKKTSTCLGHRCPLGECLPESHLCNGYIECSDGSDEKNC